MGRCRTGRGSTPRRGIRRHRRALSSGVLAGVVPEHARRPERPPERDPVVYDPDWDEHARLAEWRARVDQAVDLPAVLAAAILWDAWEELRRRSISLGSAGPGAGTDAATPEGAARSLEAAAAHRLRLVATNRLERDDLKGAESNDPRRAQSRWRARPARGHGHGALPRMGIV
nr:DUF1612 domain-containing protein [Mesorhizobium albiziae]